MASRKRPAHFSDPKFLCFRLYFQSNQNCLDNLVFGKRNVILFHGEPVDGASAAKRTPNDRS